MSSVQFPAIFEEALGEYMKKTKVDIKTDPLFAKLQDCQSSDAVLDILQKQADAFEQFREGDRKVQLMRRLKPFVDILLWLSNNDNLKESLGSIFPPSKAIFTSVGHLLKAVKGVSAEYDALIELFERFGRYLHRLEILTEIPSSVGEISVKIMAELLGVLALATQQMKEGRLKKLGKKLFGGNDIEAVLERLDRLTMEESRVTATQTMEVVNGLFKNMKVVMDNGKASIDNIRETLVTMQTISEELNKTKHDQLREKIRKWLTSPDPSINHNAACKSHKDGTAMWFLKGPMYNEWKATGSLLWVHGNPGSGKSVLCSSIIEDIKFKCATGLASVAYYYFDYKDVVKHGLRGLLSSLLTQLCARSQCSHDILQGLYGIHQDGLQQPNEGDLIQALKKVLELPRHGRVYIVVDAVDESPNTHGIPTPREDVLQFIKELVDLRHPDISICITSRPEADIQTALEPLASHDVSLHDQGGQRSDIIDYIRSVVESDRNIQQKWRAEDRQLVIDTLSQKANGMFRWVVCQLDALRRSFPTNIRRIIEEMPMTLDETYERILLEIDKEKREHAIRIFRCLAFSRRPLRARELAELPAIQFDTAIPTLNKSLRPRNPHGAVLSACSTLVTTITVGVHDVDDNNDNGVVQFSHYSVKEFLTSERLATSEITALSQYYIPPEFAHATLAQSCISTLLQLDNPIEDVSHSFPLAKYAAENWFYHAQCNGVTSRIRDGIECLFDPDRKHLAAWVSVHDIDHVSSRPRHGKPPNSSKPCPLYYAVFCGIGSLVEHLIITRGQDPNKCRGELGTPLHSAVVLGHSTIARFLLEHTADVNFHDHYISSPLHVAVERGTLDIIRLLLGYGADVNAVDDRVGSPLHQASQYRKFDVMELLVKNGANVNVRDRTKSTPLHEALKKKNLDVAQLLLHSYGADVNALDRWGDSPLHKAFRNRNFAVVDLLVKSGADMDVRDMTNLTPLHEALKEGDLDLAKLLLGYGANPNTLDQWGISPLHEAFRHWNLDVMELLVKGGADVNAQDKHNLALLHKASEIGSIDITQLLLSYGADVDALDHRGDSPLHQASRNRNLNVVDLLVDHGANVNIQDRYNSTPLHEASASGDLDIVQLLLSHGADVNVLDRWGDSPLHKASRYQKFDVVELLINGGADVNSRDMTNSTLLLEASRSRSLDIAKFLLSHGADVNGLDIWGDSPLHESFRSLTSEVVEPPLKARLKDARDSYNLTLICHASSSRNSDSVQPPSKNPTDAMNDWNDACPTPPHDASQGETYAMTRLLLEHGAEVNARGCYHRTPLHLAAFEGSIDGSRWLIERGADVLAQTDDDQTPSGIASARGHDKLAQFLLRHSVLVMCSRYARVAAVGAAAAAVATVVVNRLNRFR